MTIGHLCITFNYHMFGSDIGNLTLHLHQVIGSNPIWAASGDHGDTWLDAHIQVYVEHTFQIEMVAETGSGFRGDIAVDDVVVATGRCPTVIHCDFEGTHLCDLHNDLITDDFDWVIAHGGHMLSASTGPRLDHSTGQISGQFVYIEASSPRVVGEIARLLTPYLPVTDRGYCVSFWYFMYGQDVASLRLAVRRDDRSKDVLWERRGDLGPVWLNAKVNLPKCDYTLQIVFEAEVGASYKSDIALDDVIITEGTCV